MSELRFVRLGFGAEAVDYEEAWQEQRRVHAARLADEIPDTCLLLEHTPVFTAGRRTDPSERPVDGTPVVDVDRGGKITWHGPGQLVGYPILKLPRPVDVIAHVRRLEEAMIRTCADFGLETTRVEGRSGAWVLGDTADPSGRPGKDLGGLTLDFDPKPEEDDDEYDPRRTIMLIFPPIPMPAWLFVTLYGIFELVMGVTQTASGVAHFAHLGGMATGFVIIRYWQSQRRIRR